MPEQVPVRRTVVTLDALAASVWRAWPDGELVDVAILFGKLIAENGWPGPSQTTWNWNVGNRRGISPSGRFHVLRSAWELVPAAQVEAHRRMGWTEIPPPPQAKVTPGTVCMLPPPEKQGFAAYADLDEGVAHYLDTIGRSFRAAWAELQRPQSDARRFVEALKTDRYFTGDVSNYITNVRAGVAYALPRMPARPSPLADTWPAPAPSDGPPTTPQTPTSKSDPHFRAVRVPPAPPLPRVDAPELGPVTHETAPAEAPSLDAFLRSLADDKD
jgi:hypothetical protein